MNKMEINALCIHTRIGVHDWEQQILQRLLLDISFPIDLENCQDNLANTIDYDALCQRLTSFVEAQSFNLIETVALKVAKLLKDEFSILKLSLRVSKPDAIKNAANISVTFEQ